MKETISSFKSSTITRTITRIFIVKIGQGLRRAGDCIVKIGTGLTSQRGYLARGLMRTRIKVFTCSCHANPCTVPYRRGWRQARSFLSPLRPKPSLRRLQPLAARCKGVWGSREWAVLDSLFAIVFFNRPVVVQSEISKSAK